MSFTNDKSVLDKGVPAEALKYLIDRGHTLKAIKAANFRFLDGETVGHRYPASRRGTVTHKGPGYTLENGSFWRPLWGITLPHPDDPDYAVVRVKYDDRMEIGPKDKEPGKFLNPGGSALPYVLAPRKDLLAAEKVLYLIEGPFKAFAAATHGLPCVGVNGHSGVFEPESGRTKIRPELHDFMLTGREVVLVTDRDVHGNLDVRKSLLQFMDIAARDFGCKPVYLELPDLGDGKSGIDDYFATGKKLKDFLKLPRHARDSKVIRELKCALMNLTQLGLAERFVARHGEDCRHDTRIKEWFTYTQKGYRAGIIEPHRRLIEVVKNTLPAELAAAHGDPKARKKFLENCESQPWINAALAFAANDRSVEIDAARFDNDENLIGVANGVLRLSDGVLLPPSRDLMVTKAMACKYEAKAKAPMWQSFIARASSGKRDMMIYLQEIAGACLLGRSARQEAFFLYNKAGGSGKSLYLETLRDLFGEYAITIPAGVLVKPRQEDGANKPEPFLVTLMGKRLATCNEWPRNIVLDEAKLKNTHGGDVIAARDMYGKSINFRNHARVLIRCNYLPIIVATDDATWDRIRIVPFSAQIPVLEQDPDFRTKLIAAESSGILAWAYAGLRSFVANKNQFHVPASVEEATKQYRKSSNMLGTWADECLEIKKEERGAPFNELQTEVTKCFMEWSRANNHQPPSSRGFWEMFVEYLGYEPRYPGSGGVRVQGVRMRRGEIADSLIKHNNDEIARLTLERDIANTERDLVVLEARKDKADTAEIERLRGKLDGLRSAISGTGATISTTSKRKKDFLVIEGGRR